LFFENVTLTGISSCCANSFLILIRISLTRFTSASYRAMVKRKFGDARCRCF